MIIKNATFDTSKFFLGPVHLHPKTDEWDYLRSPIMKIKFISCFDIGEFPKGQLISECLFEKIVWTKIPTKNLIDSAHYTCWAESIKFFVGVLVQTIFSKRHFEIM